jgi:hypothetical protein
MNVCILALAHTTPSFFIRVHDSRPAWSCAFQRKAPTAIVHGNKMRREDVGDTWSL